MLPNPTKLGIQNTNYSLNEDKINNNVETKIHNILTSLPTFLKYLFSSNNSNDNKYKGFCLFPHGCGNTVQTKSLNSRIEPFLWLAKHLWPKDSLDQQPSTIHTSDEDMKQSESEVRCL